MKVLLNRMQQRGSSAADDQCWADMQAKYPAAPQGESQAELQQLVADLKAEIGERVPDAEKRERRQKSYDPADIIHEIQRHNPFSSAGPGGLKYSHLQAYLSTKWGRERIPEGLSRLLSKCNGKQPVCHPYSKDSWGGLGSWRSHQSCQTAASRTDQWQLGRCCRVCRER